MILASCPSVGTGDAFLSGVLRHLDCQAGTIGTAGYAALSDPGSPLSLALTAVLTIFIALFGLRMVLGTTPTLREGVMAVVKIGVILLIATSWPAYRTVIYDVVVTGPGQLGAAISGASGLAGDADGLVDRLQTADQAMSRLATLGSGRNDLESRPPTAAGGASISTGREPVADDPALGMARTVFLSSTIAALGGIRIMAGLLLALAPLFAGLLLFDLAHGVFVGWIRAMVFTVLASVAVSIVLGVELTVLEPWLANVLQLRDARVMTASAPLEMLVLTLAFSATLAGSAFLMLRLAFMMHIPAFNLSSLLALPSVPEAGPGPQTSIPVTSALARVGDASPRVLGVAGALSAAQRRESAFMVGRSDGHTGNARAGSSSLAGEEFAIPASAPVVRRTRTRRSVGSSLRDRRT
ncbi:type IV secretion system protein [Brevundimonas subvibrioides]|uniref:type IV secretion system protein n=1 Tax=Brevundimonas subvibrioides TaxID=74313 RepID=UPI0022B588DE|nr:type IV secretion system protein [Brevundimonas subvibrioides]